MSSPRKPRGILECIQYLDLKNAWNRKGAPFGFPEISLLNKNKKTHKENVYQNKTKNIQAAREYVWSYLLTHPCGECGEGDPSVLEFDHVRGIKRTGVMKLVRDGYSLKIIQKEISKCVVLCANCHKRKTYKDSWRDQ